MTLTPEQERDFKTVRDYIETCETWDDPRAALSRLRSDLEAATAEAERLRERNIALAQPLVEAQEEVERLRKFEQLWNDRVKMVDAEVERLRAALEPFARIDTGDRPDEYDLEGLVHGDGPNAGDVRRARQALQPTREGE